MKKLLLLLLFILLHETLDAQLINKISVELNIGRYTKEMGIFGSDYYQNDFSYINGFNIGANPSEKLQYYIAVRKINSTIRYGGGEVIESTENKGMEVKMGVKLSPRSDKRVFLSYGVELFEEASTIKGEYFTDTYGIYEINHKKDYYGIAPILTINVKVERGIIIFADTRYRYGRVNLSQKESTRPGRELHPAFSYWTGVFEPLNAVGIRFNFK